MSRAIEVLGRGLGGVRADAEWVWKLRGLPWPVVWFHWRARRLARRTGDAFSLASATRPAKLKAVVELSKGARDVVELGTGTGWTAITLALVEADRHVVSYDIVARGARRYAELVGPRVRARVEFLVSRGADVSRSDASVDFLYIDSAHGRAETIEEIVAWRPRLRHGALMVLDDYGHPEFPGVRDAVEELGVDGAARGDLFVTRS